MDDATRKAIEMLKTLNTNDYRYAPQGMGPLAAEWKDKPHRLLYDLCAAVDLLQTTALAREAEHTTPVTPEWMDGAEARRLGFERKVASGEWTDEWVAVPSDTDGYERVRVSLAERFVEVQDFDGNRAWAVQGAVPTIAQVRAAVYLATGRR